MRTTLEIDDAVLAAAKEIAETENKTAGAVISELARRGLSKANKAATGKSGFPVFAIPAGAKSFTSADIKALISNEGISPRP